MVTKKTKPKTVPPKTRVITEKTQEIGVKQWKNPAPNWLKILIATNSTVSIAVGTFVVATPLIKPEYKDFINLMLLIWTALITAAASITGIETKTKRVPKTDNT